MSNYFQDNDDLQFYFQRGIDWDAIVSATEQGYTLEGGFTSAAEAVEFYRGVADMVGGFVASEVAPRGARIDRFGTRLEGGEGVSAPEMDELFETIKGLELHGMCLPRELGGLNCPVVLYLVNTEMFARADVSVMAHYGFHGGMAMAMLMLSMLPPSYDP